MKLVRDVPGQRLTLEGESPRIPPGAMASVLLVLTLPFVYVTLRELAGADTEPGQFIAAAALALFWCGILLSAVRAARKGARWPTGLDADRAAGELRLRECGFFGWARREHILPLALVKRVTLRRTGSYPSADEIRRGLLRGKRIALTFHIRREGSETALDRRSLTFDVEHLDRHEEVADFALRLGAAAGLPFFRIVRNDAREVEVELLREHEAGFSQVPSGLTQADYARDVVAPAAQAAIAEERVVPFDPRGFRSDHRVEVWIPGSEVRLRKPAAFAVIGCLPFTLLVFTGPAIFPFIRTVGSAAGDDTLWRLFIAGFLGVFGLVFGVGAIVAVKAGLPRRVVIDWQARSILITTLTKRSEIPFGAVAAVEMKAVHHVRQGTKRTTHRYWCEIGFQVRDPAHGSSTYERLVETERIEDEPDAPYRMALPLATELAGALGVQRRLVDCASPAAAKTPRAGAPLYP